MPHPIAGGNRLEGWDCPGWRLRSYEHYDACLSRLRQSLAGIVTSADRTDHISLPRLCLAWFHCVRFTKQPIALRFLNPSRSPRDCYPTTETFVTTRNTACCYSEGISMRSPHGLHSNSTCLAPTDVTRCLRTRTPVPEMTGQSPRKRLGVSRHKNRGRAFLVIRAGPLDLIPRIPGAVRLWSKWARASRNTLLELHDTGGTDEQPSQLRSCPGRPRCDPAR